MTGRPAGAGWSPRPPVVLRTPGPGDRGALAAMYERCGRHSRHARFLAIPPRLPRDLLDRVLAPDGDVVAVVAVDPGTGAVVGLGSLHPAGRGPDGRVRAVEPALLVEDAWQRRGVGTLMARHLSAAARRFGPVTVVASVLATERHVLRMLSEVTAAPLVWTRAGAVVDVSAVTAPPPASARPSAAARPSVGAAG